MFLRCLYLSLEMSYRDVFDGPLLLTTDGNIKEFYYDPSIHYTPEQPGSQQPLHLNNSPSSLVTAEQQAAAEKQANELNLTVCGLIFFMPNLLTIISFSRNGGSPFRIMTLLGFLYLSLNCSMITSDIVCRK